MDRNRSRGCLLGLAVGDALGTTVEFRPRGTFRPVTDMVGGGPFRLKPGEWTDDTSMALCLATSLIESSGFNPYDQMARYCRWHDEGYLSSNGRCFDIGNTVSNALARYQRTGEPFSGSTDPASAGNGSIMRLAPVVLFYFPEQEQIWHYSAESSRTTHGTAECLDACRLLGEVLFRGLSGEDKQQVLSGTDPARLASASIRSIAASDYRHKSAGEIRGSGYAVHSLEAALWCFWTTSTFAEAVLAAVNLGEDADTTAAVCGQVAGAYYGEAGIPERWLERLAMGEAIGQIAERLSNAGPASRPG